MFLEKKRKFRERSQNEKEQMIQSKSSFRPRINAMSRMINEIKSQMGERSGSNYSSHSRRTGCQDSLDQQRQQKLQE